MSETKLHKIHVLLVDDEKDLHLLYNEFLSKKVTSQEIVLYNFYNGKECLDFIEKGLPGDNVVLITDINMPIMDGFELLENLKGYNDTIKRWVMSAYNSPEFIARAEQYKCKGFLPKPISYKKIIEIITQPD